MLTGHLSLPQGLHNDICQPIWCPERVSVVKSNDQHSRGIHYAEEQQCDNDAAELLCFEKSFQIYSYSTFNI